MPKKTSRYEYAKRSFKLSAGASRYERQLADFAWVLPPFNFGFIGQGGSVSNGSTGLIDLRLLISFGAQTRRWKIRF